MKLDLTERERDTMLAALRLWQWEQESDFEELYFSDRGKALIEIAENGRKSDDATLSPEEIETLCERLTRAP